MKRNLRGKFCLVPFNENYSPGISNINVVLSVGNVRGKYLKKCRKGKYLKN